jgi:hypothetical protein
MRVDSEIAELEASLDAFLLEAEAASDYASQRAAHGLLSVASILHTAFDVIPRRLDLLHREIDRLERRVSAG